MGDSGRVAGLDRPVLIELGQLRELQVHSVPLVTSDSHLSRAPGLRCSVDLV